MRLQGHRKRRRAPEVKELAPEANLSWTEYKVVRQYQSLGDLLDECKVYGTKGAVEILSEEYVDEFSETSMRNGHRWLTKDEPK